MASPWSWQSGLPSFIPYSIDSRQQPSRVWHRPFWGAEIAFAAGTLVHPGFADMLISCNIHVPPSASFNGDLVREATRCMRFNHPTIAATLSYPSIERPQDFNPLDGRLVYEAPLDESDVKIWLDEAVQDRSALLDQTHGNIDEAISLLRLELGAANCKRSRWMFEVFYLVSKTGSVHGVLFHLGHTLFDGIGSFEVMDLWLRELAKVSSPASKHEDDVDWGAEGVRLALPVPDRAKYPWKPERTPADHYILEQIRKGLTRPPFQFGLPILKPHAAEPGTTGTILKTLPAPTAALLRNSARKHGCGVFSVILAANYLSILHLNPPKEFTGELYAHLFPNATDLRGKYLVGGSAAKLDRSTWQVTSALGANIIVAHNLERFLGSDDMTAAVWQLAKEIQEQVTAQQPYQETAFQWVPDAMALLMSAFFSGPSGYQPDRVVNISSLGVVDDSLAKVYPVPSVSSGQAIEISDPVFSGIGPALQVLDVLAIVHPYTWQDVLYLSFSFPTAYMGSLEEQYLAASQGMVTMQTYTEEFASLLKKLSEC